MSFSHDERESLLATNIVGAEKFIEQMITALHMHVVDQPTQQDEVSALGQAIYEQFNHDAAVLIAAVAISALAKAKQ